MTVQNEKMWGAKYKFLSIIKQAGNKLKAVCSSFGVYSTNAVLI